MKAEVCKLFCSSLLLERSDDTIRVRIYVSLSLLINQSLVSYLRWQCPRCYHLKWRDEKYKVDEALRYSKAKLADTRTDERRKVCCLIIHEAQVI